MSTLLITGANRGLGLEFARQYAADGWSIIACCRNPAKAEALQALATKNKNIRLEAVDVTNGRSIAGLAEKLKDMAVDVLINNAGIYSGDTQPRSSETGDKGQRFGSLDPEAWDKVLRTNTVAPIMVTQALIPNLLQGKERKIIMITSRMGSIEMTKEGDIAYRSSKAALNAAMRNVALRLQSEKITVVGFHPGWVQTDMGGSHADITPEASIAGMRKLIGRLVLKDSGQFFDYKGDTLPW